MEEVSETSEPDLFSSDEDCSDTADVGPEGAVAARWPESSCDSSPITDSGHHAEQRSYIHTVLLGDRRYELRHMG